MKLNDFRVPSQASDRVEDAVTEINNFQIPAADLNISTVNTGGTDIHGLENLNLPSPVQDLKIDRVGDLSNIPGDNNKVLNNIDKAGDTGTAVQSVANGNLELEKIPDAAEAKAQELSGLDEIKDQNKVLDDHKTVLKKMQNPDSLKEFATQEAEEMAMDHFAGKEEELRAAMATMTKYKKKYPSVNSLEDLRRKPPNEMRGKPLIGSALFLRLRYNCKINPATC